MEPMFSQDLEARLGLGEEFEGSFEKLNMELPYDPETLLLDIHRKYLGWELDVGLPGSHTVDNGGEGGTTQVSQADEWVNKLGSVCVLE